MNTPRLRSALTASICLLASPAGIAGSVAIVNADFETGGFSTDNFSRNPGVIPTGWTTVGSTTGAFFGYLNPDNSAFLGTTGGTSVALNMSGPNVFYFGSLVTGQGIQQTLSANFAADTDYTLTVALGSRNGNLINTASLDVRLLAGATVLASATFRNTDANGTFSDYDLIYAYSAANAALVGQALTIQFIENDIVRPGEVDIDNVRLVSTAIPEPGSAALALGLFGAGLAAFRRRRIA